MCKTYSTVLVNNLPVCVKRQLIVGYRRSDCVGTSDTVVQLEDMHSNIIFLSVDTDHKNTYLSPINPPPQVVRISLRPDRDTARKESRPSFK